MKLKIALFMEKIEEIDWEDVWLIIAMGFLWLMGLATFALACGLIALLIGVSESTFGWVVLFGFLGGIVLIGVGYGLLKCYRWGTAYAREYRREEAQWEGQR